MEGEFLQPPLRILMVSDFFHPNIGGVESHIYHLSQCLLARGHKVVVFTHSYGDIQGVKYLTNGLKVYYHPRLPFHQSDTFPTVFGAFPALRDVILRERITLLHAHQAFSTMSHEAVLHGRTMGLRVVFTDHSLFGFADAASILINKVLKFTLADVHAVICVSHTSKENTVLRACIPPHRVYVVPNAVDASLFRPREPSDNNHNSNNHEGASNNGGSSYNGSDISNNGGSVFQEEEVGEWEGPTVVVMSRLVYRKGIDLLAAVLPELCHRHPTVRFLIGGDGPKRPMLEQAIEDAEIESQVTLIGAVAHENVRDLLIKGQVFLNCSLTEAFCIALVEAAAAGLLVVSTRVGGVPEVLPEDMLILAEPSPAGVVDAVGQALARVLLRKDGDAQRQHEAMAQMYSWPAVAQRTERVYYEAMHSGRDDGVAARMARFYKCGKWFGKICCAVATVDWMYWKYLEWWKPAGSIVIEQDIPLSFLLSSQIEDGEQHDYR